MIDDSKVKQVIVFPTRVLSYMFDDVSHLNQELREVILEREKTLKSIKFSNVGGYHSSVDLLEWDFPCIKTLLNMFIEMTSQMANHYGLQSGLTLDLKFSAWANIMRNGNYHVMHNHPNNFWSGCYYVSTGQPDHTVPLNSFFEITDPRPGATMISSTSMATTQYYFQPEDGMILMFPSFLEHLVHPYIGDGERISIAFNVSLRN